MKLQSPDVVSRWRRFLRMNSPVLWTGVLAPLLLLMAALLVTTRPVTATGPAGSGGVILPAASSTPVGGTISISTTWALTDSPYIVMADVTVDSQAVLTIEAGVVVSFSAGTGLYIGDDLGTPGRLVAEGTNSDRIQFTAHYTNGGPARGFWNGIEFAGNSPTNTLRYCLIEYAGTGVTSGDSDGHVIDYCIFRYNSDDGSATSGGAINLDGDRATVTHNQMYGNELGLRLRKSNRNTITDNWIYDSDRFGISFIVEGGSGGSNNQILDNRIYDNGGDGLHLDDGSNNYVISNHIYQNGRDGVWAGTQTTLRFTDNIVHANGGNGLTCAACDDFLVSLHSNVLCSNDNYDIEHLFPTSLLAQGNWFGTNTPSDGSEVSGTVSFTPAISMALIAAPTLLPADGASTAVVTITMVGGGHAVPDGYEALVTASEGNLNPSPVSFASGQTTSDYTAGTIPGAVDITVTDLCAPLLFTEVLTLEATLDLVVIKDDGLGLTMLLQPEKAYVISYTFTYSNEGDIDALGVVLTDTLPAGTQVYDSNGWNCVSDTCTYTVGTVPVGVPQATPPLVVEVLDCGDLRNEVTIGPPTSDSDLADNTSTVTTSVPCLPDLVVVKNDNVWPRQNQPTGWIFDLLDKRPAQVDPLPCVDVGERITYTILYLNSGLATASQVVLTETVPANTHYAGTGWTCAGSTCTHTVGSLPPGGAGAASFVVEVDAVPPDLLITNEVRIGGAEEDLYPPDNVSFDHSHICEPVGVCLQVSKDDNLPCAFPGDEIRYTITFSNTCDWIVSNVVLTETLPISTSYLTSPGWLPAGGDQYAYYHGGLPAHMTGTVQFVVRVDDPLPDTVTETVNRVCVGRDGAAGPEDCFDLLTPLPLVADLRVVKHDYVGPPPPRATLEQLKRYYGLLSDHAYSTPSAPEQWSPVRPGDVFSYTITYLNLGRSPATGVVLTDTLPARTSYVGYGWTRVNATNTYTWPVGDLPVGAVGQRNLWVRVRPVPCSEEYLYNWAFIGGNEEECNLENNWSGEETPVECTGFYQSYLPIVMRGYAPPPLPTPPTPTPPPTTPPPEDAYVSDVAVNPETNRVYVASPRLDAVWAVDPTGGLAGDDYILATIGVGDHPLGLAVVSTTNKIYAANLRSNNVTSINGDTHAPITNITVGVEPCKVAADSADERVYLTNHGEYQGNAAAAINSSDDTFTYYYKLNGAPGTYGIDVDPAAEKLFVAARDGGLIAIQEAYLPDQDPLIIKLDPPRVPFLAAFNPATNHLFVTAPDDNLVVVLDPYNIQLKKEAWTIWRGRPVFVLTQANAGWIAEIPVGNGAEEGIAVNPLTGFVYVTNADDNTMSIIQDDADAANIQWVMDLGVGEYPQGVDVDITRNLIYVGNADSRDLTVILFDGVDHSVVKTIPLY
jgi:uncharacterized repeat protein (TIGR01451 family)